MNFECPIWLQQLAGITPGGDDELVVGRIELLRPLGATATLAVAVAACAVVWYCYRGGDGGGKRGRAVMAVLRLMTIALVVALIGELSISLRRAGLAAVVLLVDDSESMNIDDKYVDAEYGAALAKRIARAKPTVTSPAAAPTATSSAALSTAASSGAAAPTSPAARRLDAVQTLMLEDDAAFLRRFSDRNYQVRAFAVSDAARSLPHDPDRLRSAIAELTATGRTTRLGDGVRSSLEQLRGQPLAAVVLVSDGVNTAGGSLPEATAAAAQRNVPFFAIGVGETKKAIDVELQELKAPDYAMVNDLVGFEVTLTARGSEGRQVEVTLTEADQKTPLTSKRVTAGKDDVGVVVRLTHRPTKIGTFRYIVEAKPIEGETAVDNNRLAATVEIRTDKIEVLFVQSYPSFEYRYLKHMLQRDETVHLTTILQEADREYQQADAGAESLFPVTLEGLLKYDVVIFGDVDPDFLGASALTNLREFVINRGRGVIFAAGPQYMPQAYRNTPLADLFPFEDGKATLPASDTTIADGSAVRLAPAAAEEALFQLADTSEASRRIWQNLPPLYWFLEAEPRRSAQVMVEAVDRKTSDGRAVPAILFQRAHRGMVLFHTTDETWRWRFRVGDFYFARYWVQALRFLSMSKGSGRPVVVRVGRDEFDSGRPVPIEVRFQDERSAPPDGKLHVIVESEGRPDQIVTLTQRHNLRSVYEAVVSGLPEGRYRVRLPSTFEPPAGSDADSRNTSILTDEFTVAPLRAEATPIEADHENLIAAAKAGNGEFYTLADAGRLFDRLPRGRLLPTEPLPPIGLWNKWFTLLLLTALLTGEWILRKRRGLI